MLPKKIIKLFLLLTLLLVAREGFEYRGISVKAKNAKGKIETFIVKRHIHNVCKNIIISNRMLWTQNYAHKDVPKECKSTYVHTTGKLLPMQLDDEVTTYGELEVLSFIKDMTTNPKLLLVDARGEEWFNYRTIPSAINLPFAYFKHKDEYEFEVNDGLETLGVTIEKDETLNFKKAKIITVFCNGAWCSQSVWFIEALLELGYPAHKINWYRGGMQNWLASGMTSTKD